MDPVNHLLVLHVSLQEPCLPAAHTYIPDHALSTRLMIIHELDGDFSALYILPRIYNRGVAYHILCCDRRNQVMVGGGPRTAATQG